MAMKSAHGTTAANPIIHVDTHKDLIIHGMNFLSFSFDFLFFLFSFEV